MDKENNWSEISENASDLSKKIKDKIYEENLVSDIKESFKETIHNTTNILNDLSKTIDSTVKDENIKKESKEIINMISSQIQGDLKNITEKLTDNQNFGLEEE
tara:strand:- start:1712 stop:2020 length:309 start_codon:yes stop_codon:yes gene_type:complete